MKWNKTYIYVLYHISSAEMLLLSSVNLQLLRLLRLAKLVRAIRIMRTLRLFRGAFQGAPREQN